MNKRLWLLGAIVLVIGVGVGVAFAWWSQNRAMPSAKPIDGPPADIKPVLEKPAELPAGGKIKLFRVVLHIASGTLGTAVRDYLKAQAEQGPLSDLYEIFTNQGRALAVGPALAGRLERIPAEIKKILNPWKQTILLGAAHGMIVYQVQ